VTDDFCFMRVILTKIFLIFFVVAVAAIVPGFAQNYSKATITGQLLKSNGKPLAYTEIELVPVEARKIVVNPKLLSTSSAGGRFIFFDVPAGKYTLSVNFDEKPTDLSPFPTFFYPNTTNRSDADVFEINENFKSKNVSFKLPPALVKRRVNGRIVGLNGEAIGGAFIFIRDVDFDDSYGFGQVRADKNGIFSFSAFGDRKYQCGAILFEELSSRNGFPFFGEILAEGETQIFTPALSVTNIAIILKQSKRDNRIKDKYVGKIVFKDNETVPNS